MALLLAGASVAAVAIPAARLQIDGPSAGAFVIAARGLAEILAAGLAAQRFHRSASRRDFAVAVGFGVMAAADVGYALTGPTLDPDGASAAAVLQYQVAGAGLLAAAALSSDRPLVRRGRRRIVLGGIAATSLAVLLLQDAVVTLAGDDTTPAVVTMRAAACALLVIAAGGFTLRSARRGDDVSRWLAAAVMLLALVQLQHIWGPGGLTQAHGLQLAAVVILVIGSAEEIRRRHLRVTELALAEERRRMARDLHDGLLQDVAFIASQSQDLAERSGDPRLVEIAAAARRALEESRSVVGTLTRDFGLPLSASIAVQAQVFARRSGVTVRLALQDDVDVAPETQHAILRIVGEALSNAARHADARTVDIALGDRDGRLHVAVCDDGRGFDADLVHRGFGLKSMRERAVLVGGALQLESEPGVGTKVRIAIP